MGTAYATTADLANRWRPLTSAEDTRATVLLEDAAAKIRSEFRRRGWTVEYRLGDGQLEPGDLKIVSCEMVKRAMLAAVDQAPMQQFSDTTGPFSQSGTFVNPTGDLYLTKADKRMLGFGQEAHSLPLAGTATTVHRPWCALAFGAAYCSCGADIAGEPIFEAS